MASPPPQRDPWFGCLLWQGGRNSNDYGTDWSDGRPRLAHLAAWERARGPIPPEHQLDHLCRRRLCIALPHLEVVTRSENLRRRAWAYRARRERCGAGHSLLEHGRRTPEAGVVCRICSGVWKPERA